MRNDMKRLKPALAFDAIKGRISFDGLLHIGHISNDWHIEAFSKIALPIRHRGDVGLHRGVAVPLAICGLPPERKTTVFSPFRSAIGLASPIAALAFGGAFLLGWRAGFCISLLFIIELGWCLKNPWLSYPFNLPRVGSPFPELQWLSLPPKTRRTSFMSIRLRVLLGFHSESGNISVCLFPLSFPEFPVLPMVTKLLTKKLPRFFVTSWGPWFRSAKPSVEPAEGWFLLAIHFL